MVYPYFSEYLMKPFLSLINIRIYLGVVSVAYSNPPGTIPMGFFAVIKRQKFV